MKRKVLILKGEISPYNVPVYNILSKKYDLTLGYYTKDESKSVCDFKKILFESRKIGPFIIISGLHKFCDNFDVVCFVPDLHVLSYCLLPFLSRKFSLVNWSIGFRVSYTHPYITTRRHNLLDRITMIIYNHCDASIFYMEKSKDFWKGTSLLLDKIFVAPNTAAVATSVFNLKSKKDFLFVGTLYKGKGLDLLLDSYNKAIMRTKSNVKLRIVGDGEMKEYIVSYVKENDLEEKVVIEGAIYDETRLADEYNKSILCISPAQAGLSVPKSMGYGVPFVTSMNAITGGEIYHITNMENGILYERNEELTEIMVDAIVNPNKYIEMGLNAKNYYNGHATIQHMANGVIDAFEYSHEQCRH